MLGLNYYPIILIALFDIYDCWSVSFFFQSKVNIIGLYFVGFRMQIVAIARYISQFRSKRQERRWREKKATSKAVCTTDLGGMLL